jgi:hypothetical protein
VAVASAIAGALANAVPRTPFVLAAGAVLLAALWTAVREGRSGPALPGASYETTSTCRRPGAAGTVTSTPRLVSTTA